MIGPTLVPVDSIAVEWKKKNVTSKILVENTSKQWPLNDNSTGLVTGLLTGPGDATGRNIREKKNAGQRDWEKRLGRDWTKRLGKEQYKN